MDPDRTFEIEGHTLGYPTEFRDGTSMMAMMTASSCAVQRLLGDIPFVVAEPIPRRAVVGVNCVHYTDTDCGVYEEVALSVFVDPYRDRPNVRYLSTIASILGGAVPSYTWRLGVSTTLARDCGIRMWGFPKQMADLRFTSVTARDRMAWRAEGTTVLELAVPRGGQRTNGPISPPVYSLIDGRPHVGRLNQTYTGVGYHRRRVDLMLGEGPVADELRSLDLSRPLVGVHNAHLRFHMSSPQPLGS